MVKHSNGVGYFTAENIVGALRALPETDGTYAEVVEHAREYGVTISKTVLAKWVAEGHRDLQAGRRQSAFGRFATMYDQIKEEHCTAEGQPEPGIRPRHADPGEGLRLREGQDDAA